MFRCVLFFSLTLNTRLVVEYYRELIDSSEWQVEIGDHRHIDVLDLDVRSCVGFLSSLLRLLCARLWSDVELRKKETR